jgi:hypothetical protein
MTAMPGRGTRRRRAVRWQERDNVTIRRLAGAEFHSPAVVETNNLRRQLDRELTAACKARWFAFHFLSLAMRAVDWL